MRGNPACSHHKGIDAEIRHIERLIARTQSEYMRNILIRNLEIAKQKRAALEEQRPELLA